MLVRYWHQQGEDILDKYDIKVSPRAAADIDNTYCHIADDFKDEELTSRIISGNRVNIA